MRGKARIDFRAARKIVKFRQEQDITELPKRLKKIASYNFSAPLLLVANKQKLMKMLTDFRLARKSVLAALRETRRSGSSREASSYKRALINADKSIRHIKNALKEHELREN